MPAWPVTPSFSRCFPQEGSHAPDLRAMLICALLFAAMPLYRQFRKKKLSPISLIVLSALLGVLIY